MQRQKDESKLLMIRPGLRAILNQLPTGPEITLVQKLTQNDKAIIQLSAAEWARLVNWVKANRI